jgi:hypothetical protein
MPRINNPKNAASPLVTGLVVGTVRTAPLFISLPQCLQTTAASWMSSAHNGHFFISPSIQQTDGFFNRPDTIRDAHLPLPAVTRRSDATARD